jgi:hypothetical protein
MCAVQRPFRVPLSDCRDRSSPAVMARMWHGHFGRGLFVPKPVIVRPASASTCPTWEGPSVSACRRPPLTVTIVTQPRAGFAEATWATSHQCVRGRGKLGRQPAVCALVHASDRVPVDVVPLYDVTLNTATALVLD